MTTYRPYTVACPECHWEQGCNILSSWSIWGPIRRWSDGYASEGGFVVSTPYVSCAACKALFLPYEHIVKPGLPEPSNQQDANVKRQHIRWFWNRKPASGKWSLADLIAAENSDVSAKAWPPTLEQMRETLAERADRLTPEVEAHLRIWVFWNDGAPDRDGAMRVHEYPLEEAENERVRAYLQNLNDQMRVPGNAERLVELLQAKTRPNPLLLGQVLKHLGRFEEAIAVYRHHVPIHHPWRALLVSMADQRDAQVVELPPADFKLPRNPNRRKYPMAAELPDGIDPEMFEIDYDSLDEEVRTTGELVAYQDWDSGETGAGAGRVSVYRYEGQFYTDTDVGIDGPFPTFDRAAEGSAVLLRTDATVETWVAAEFGQQGKE